MTIAGCIVSYHTIILLYDGNTTREKRFVSAHQTECGTSPSPRKTSGCDTMARCLLLRKVYKIYIYIYIAYFVALMSIIHTALTRYPRKDYINIMILY